MGTLAVLKFGNGSFQDGFPVTLRLGNEGEPATVELDGNLPAAPSLLELAQTWQFSYRSRGSFGSYRQLKARPAQVTRQRSSLVSVSNDWICALNDWLNGGDRCFQPIRDRVLKALSQDDDIRLVIQAEQLELWQLPWHLWDLVQDHPNVDVTFSLGTFTRSDYQQPRTNSQIRILVLLGDSTDINIQTDLKLLKNQLPNAEIYSPEQVHREQVCHDLWQQSWNLLFFAGHSSSHLNEGRFYLTPEVYLTIDDLRYALQRAIANGLQLAIFNSCDGLELARQLADLQLPAAIVMRERIPDEAAQKFLHYFLDSFAHTNQSLHLAVRDAREKLHAALDDKYPCASWLPIVYQSPISEAVYWRSLYSCQTLTNPEIVLSSIVSHSNQRLTRLKRAFAVGIIATCIVLGVRELGWLEMAELWTYDQLIQLQPQVPPDDRILIIGVNETDIQRYDYPLADQTIAELLQRVSHYQPRVIGLDILRPSPTGQGWQQLLQQLQHSDRTVALCQVGEANNRVSTDPPPGISVHDRVGYNDGLLPDRNRTIRRYTLTMNTDPPCNTPHSFSFQVLRRYLPPTTQYEYNNTQSWIKIDQTPIQVFTPNFGGYKTDLTLGYQILIRYRSSTSVAPEISLTKALTLPEADLKSLVNNRIVLIGYVGESARDFHPTSLGTLPGVHIHAHVISQLLDRVSGQHSQITAWNDLIEAIWIGCWGVIGAILGQIRFKDRKIIIQAIGFCTLTMSFYALSLLSIWSPFIPAALAYALSTFEIYL